MSLPVPSPLVNRVLATVVMCFLVRSRYTEQAAVSAVVFHVTHMILSVILKWVLVQRFDQVDGVCYTTSWLGFRKQVKTPRLTPKVAL